jgi:hypothetical protein
LIRENMDESVTVKPMSETSGSEPFGAEETPKTEETVTPQEPTRGGDAS